MNISFTPNGWADYLYLQANDRRILKKVNVLIKDIVRDGNDGLGKPERLSGNLSGWLSRRINHTHRLVYRLTDDAVEIASCRHHYGK